MAAESLYLLVIIGFALQKIRDSNRTAGLTVLIRAFGRMPVSPIVGTEIPSAKATFGISLLSMRDLGDYALLEAAGGSKPPGRQLFIRRLEQTEGGSHLCGMATAFE